MEKGKLYPNRGEPRANSTSLVGVRVLERDYLFHSWILENKEGDYIDSIDTGRSISTKTLEILREIKLHDHKLREQDLPH